MTYSNFEIETEIKNNKPYLDIVLEYRDSFTDDKFNIKAIIEDVNNINFFIVKNKRQISNVNVKNRNFENFFNETFKSINDFDFKQEFNKNHKSKIISELENFINKINSSIIIENKFIDGYRDKMKLMSGIIINENIR
jgi:hypothetical protein